MQADRAMETLGLSNPMSRESIRRAYLKKVRAHPPERDPDGFRRIREAYETLEGMPWLWLEAKSEPEASPSLVRVTAPVAPVSSPIVFSPPSLEPAPLPFEPAPPPDTPAPADAEAEPLAEISGEPEPEGPSTAAAPNVDAVEPEADEDDDAPDWHSLSFGLDEEPLDEVADLVLEALDADSFATVLPPPELVIGVILRLYEAREGAQAAYLLRAFDDAEKKGHYPPRQFGPSVAAQWHLVNELDALGDHADARLKQLLAKGIRTGDFDEARREVEDYAKIGDALRRSFAAAAPTLFATVWPREPARETKAWFFGPWHWIWVALVVVRCAYHTSRDKERDDPPPPRPVMVAPRSVPAMEELLGEADASADLRVLTYQEQVDTALASFDCSRMREVWPAYVRAFRRLDMTPDQRTALAERHARATEACPELATDLEKTP